MKILLALITGMLLFANVNAQTTTTTKTNKNKTTVTTTAKAKPVKVKDCFKKTETMMLVVKNGVTTTMSVDTHLKNGTVILTDGTVVLRNGKKFKLEPGQSIDVNGKVAGVAKGKKAQ